MACVCGGPRDAHRNVTMSVPLNGKPAESLGGVAYTYPSSTYDRDECGHCGCCQYIEDVEDVAAASA